MKSPGVEVRPLRTMSGDATFSELFFTDVRVPGSALLGPLHGGWRVAMTTLSHERPVSPGSISAWRRGSTSCWPTPGPGSGAHTGGPRSPGPPLRHHLVHAVDDLT